MMFKGRLKVREQERARNVVATRVAGGIRHLSAIEQFRELSTSKDLAQKFRTAFGSLTHLRPIIGEPFPRNWESLYVDFPVPSVMDLEKELVWAALVCGLASAEIQEYLILRNNLEALICQGQYEEAVMLLDEVEGRFGKSMWLAQNRLGVLQEVGDANRLDEARNSMLEEARGRGLSSFLLKMLAKKFEVNGVVGQLAKEIDSVFKSGVRSQATIYIRSRFLRQAFPEKSEIPILLNFESACSVIDYYEALVSSLRSLLSNPECHKELQSAFGFMQVSLSRINDDRLALHRAIFMKNNAGLDDRGLLRGELADHTIAGNRDAALLSWERYARLCPSDIVPLINMIDWGGKCDFSMSDFMRAILSNYEKVHSKSSESYAAALSLFEVTERFGNHTWSAALETAVRYQLATIGDDRDRLELMSISADTVLSPNACLLESGERTSAVVEDLFGRLSPLHRRLVQAKMGRYTGVESEAYDLISRAGIQGALLVGDSDLALKLIERHAGGCGEGEARELRSQEAMALCQKGKYVEAATSVVEGIRFEDGAPTIYPIKAVACGLEDKKQWADSIDVPLLYEIYLSFIGKGKITNLRLSFEKFQEKSKIKIPSDMLGLVDKVGVKRVVSYLSDVWKPEVMRQTVLYPTSAEIEDARIEVCKVLQDLDSSSATIYRDEFKQRVRRREIGKGTSLVEKSKVYVDMAAIRRTLKAKLDVAYTKYKGAASSSANLLPGDVKKLYEVFDKAERSGRGDLAGALESMHLIIGPAKTDADVQFDSIYSQVMAEFVSGENGLNAYLSTRVRHGKLANALRKPLMDERIISARNKDGSYVPNTHWDALVTTLDSDLVEKVKLALLRFSERFDNVVDFVNEKVIVVSVASSAAARDFSDPAAFKYYLSEIERRHLQEIDRDASTFDNFIDRCMDRLWQKTDLMLDSLRSYLATNLRSKIINSFEILISDLDGLGDSYPLRNIQSSIGRARTNAQHKINEIVAWFKRDEFYDRNDYACEFSAQVALSIVNKTLPSEMARDGVPFNVSGLDWLMPGRTLDGMVDMFDVLVMNSVHHSMLKPQQLDVRITGGMDDQRARIIFSSRVSDDVDFLRGRAKLAEIAGEMNHPDFGRRAQREGNSGLLKIWRTLNSTFYSHPDLKFDYMESSDGPRFEVEYSFIVEGLS